MKVDDTPVGDGGECLGVGASVPERAGHEPSRSASRPSGDHPSRNRPVKSLEDVKADMTAVYDALAEGSIDLKLAAELANITGKFLKAEQLQLAREMFAANRPEQKASIHGV